MRLEVYHMMTAMLTITMKDEKGRGGDDHPSKEMAGVEYEAAWQRGGEQGREMEGDGRMT